MKVCQYKYAGRNGGAEMTKPEEVLYDLDNKARNGAGGDQVYGVKSYVCEQSCRKVVFG